METTKENPHNLEDTILAVCEILVLKDASQILQYSNSMNACARRMKTIREKWERVSAELAEAEINPESADLPGIDAQLASIKNIIENNRKARKKAEKKLLEDLGPATERRLAKKRRLQ